MRALSIGDGLELPAEAVTQTFAILAKRGVGKTYTALVLVEELLGAGAQVVIADPVGVTWGLRAAANGKDPGLPIIVMGGDHGDVPLEASAGKVVAEFVVDTRSSVVLDLSLLRKGDQVRFMTDFAETLYHRNRAPLHLVLDEADAFAPQRPLHGQERMLGAIQDLVRRGRARGIGVTLVTQRAAVLSKDVLTQVEVLVALRTIAPQDRAAIEAWIEAHDAHGQRAEFMTSLASLPIGTAWFWSPGWLDVFQRVKVRARRTFDSSATPKVGSRPAGPKKLADVDLEALRGRIAATIEKAKAEDPRELRRQVAELKAQLAELRAQLAKTPTAALAGQAQRVEVKVREVKVRVFSEPLMRRFEVAAKKALRAAELHEKAAQASTGGQGGVLTALEGLRADLGTARTPENNLLAALRPHLETMSDAEIEEAITRTHEILAGLRPTSMPAHAPASRSLPQHVAAPPRSTSAHGPGTPPAGLTKMLHAMLTALAQHPEGLTKRKIRIYTGYAESGPVSASFATMNARGWTETSGDRLRITPAGLDALGPFEPLPIGEALRAQILNDPGRSTMERAFLTLLFTAYPEPMSKAELRTKAGYAESGPVSATFAHLVGRDWAVAVGKGMLRAAEEFFA